MSIINTNLDNMLKSTLPALGIDIGGTKISAALVRDCACLSPPVQYPTPKGSENILAKIIEIINEFNPNNIIGVGIATAGIVDVNLGRVIDSTFNIPGWAGTSIKSNIESKTFLPVYVENDANAAAYGEFRANSSLRDKIAVIVTLGTGIGGGIIINNNVFHGHNFAAGEIGHLKISFDNKRLCTCGHFDCWEAYGSGTGFLQTAKEFLKESNSINSSLFQFKENLTNADVIDASHKNDILALNIMNAWHKHIAIGLDNLAQILNPHAFVISGGMSTFVNFDLLSELVEDSTLKMTGQDLQIYQSKLGVNAGIIGAGELALSSVLDKVHY